MRHLPLPAIFRERRWPAFALSVALHLLLLALLIGWQTGPVKRPSVGGINAFDIIANTDAEAQQAQEAEDTLVDVSTVPAASDFPVEVPQLAVDAASTGQFGENCGIAAAIQADLLVDAAARAELAAIPFDERSVANAIVMWAGTPDQAQLATPPVNVPLFGQSQSTSAQERMILPAVDAVILNRLRSVPEQCLDLEQIGPDFIYVKNDFQTVSITFGSGRWRWRNFFDFLVAAMQPSTEPKRT